MGKFQCSPMFAIQTKAFSIGVLYGGNALRENIREEWKNMTEINKLAFITEEIECLHLESLIFFG